MSYRGALILAGLFVVAFALLGIGQCGYKKIKTLQTLENAEADVVSQFPSVNTIRGGEVNLHQEAGQSVILVDARTPDEFEVSHLEGAVNFTDLEDLLAFLKGRPEPADLVVIYGALGYRSAKLAEALQKNGVENISHLRGGIFRWANEGGSLVNVSEEPVLQVHPVNKHWGRLLNEDLRYKSDEGE